MRTALNEGFDYKPTNIVDLVCPHCKNTTHYLVEYRAGLGPLMPETDESLFRVKKVKRVGEDQFEIPEGPLEPAAVEAVTKCGWCGERFMYVLGVKPIVDIYSMVRHVEI